MSSEQANFTPSAGEHNVEESKVQKVVPTPTPGQKTTIKSGDAYNVFAVMRRNAETGKTDFCRVDGVGSVQDGERFINLDDIPSQERKPRQPKKEREPREKSAKRDRSAKREKKEKKTPEDGVYEKIEKKLRKFVNGSFEEKKKTKEWLSPEDYAQMKAERAARRAEKRIVNAQKFNERQERKKSRMADKADDAKASGQVQEAH